MKNKKSLVALVVMAFMLVASITMAATGAWFTDKDATTEKKLTFGTLDITGVSENVTVANTYGNLTGPVMPGSTIKGKLTINYAGTADAYYRYKVVFGGAGADKLTGTNSEWVYDAVTGGAEAQTITKEIEVTVDTNVDNGAQGQEITLNITVEFIQKANTAATPQDAFTTVGDTNIVTK